MSERSYDIVLFGATGFTGRLVAEYLVQTYEAGSFRLALAGRSQDKLEAVRRDLTRIAPWASELPILLADSSDRAALDVIAQATKVVCTTVGPYAKYGPKLVAACAAAGTDYCDLTGEAHFVRRMIDAHHEEAQKTGARIVHACGFDSIPSDLGVWILHREMADRHGGTLDEVKLFVTGAKGGASGGTIASALNIVEESAKDRSVARVVMDPYGLVPERAGSARGDKDAFTVRFDADLGQWTGPFVMAMYNTRIVRRTNALLDDAYGENFRYSEVTATGKGPGGAARAAGLVAGLGAFAGAIGLSPTRALLKKTVLPAPGEGPNEEARRTGFYKMKLIAKGRDRDGKPVELRARVEGKGDPGYGATSRMLAEAALCLATATPAQKGRGGVLTPVSAMADPLLERLLKRDFVFSVEG